MITRTKWGDFVVRLNPHHAMIGIQVLVPGPLELEVSDPVIRLRILELTIYDLLRLCEDRGVQP